MWRLLLGLLASCSLIVDPPKSDDVLVNSITQLDQGDPAVAYANERYLVVWQDSSVTSPDTSGDAIRGRFLTREGVPLGVDILINDPNNASLSQEEPDVAASRIGMFVVWTDQSGLGGDPSPSIKGRFIATTGEISPERLINSTLESVQSEVAIAATDGDGFVVVWTDASGAALEGEDIRGRIIESDGTLAAANDFIINATLAGNQTEPAIARGPDNQLLVVWTETTAAGRDIRGRLLSSSGMPIGTDFSIAAATTGLQQAPSVTATTRGYLVSWTDQSLRPGDIDGSAVRARFLDTTGTPIGGDDLVVNTTTAGDQGKPRAVLLSDGSVVVAFEDERLDPSSTEANNVRIRRFEADDVSGDDDFVVHGNVEGNQEDVGIAADDAGGALVVWEDESAAAPDNSGNGVRSVRLRPRP